MPPVTDKLGKLLISANLITEKQLNEALVAIRQSRGATRLGSTLVKMGYIQEEKLLQFLSQQYRVPAVDLKMYQHIDPAIIKLVPLELVKKHMVLPLRRVGATVTVTMLDPTNMLALDDLKFRTNYTIEPVIAAESALIEAVKKYYGAGVAGGAAQAAAAILQAKDYTIPEGSAADELADLGQADAGPMVDVEDFDKTVGDVLDSVEVAESDQDQGMIGEVEAPIIKLVNGILVNAMKVGASDVHVEPYETVFRIRYRIDGDLQTVMNLPLKVKNSLISRIKIMAKLDIAERRLPQDGRIKLKLGPKRDIDFRVSVLPTLFGEKGVLRLLDKANIQVDKDKLGFDKRQEADINAALAMPYGMILVTGPRLCRRICKDCKVPDPTVTREILKVAGASKANEEDFAKMTPMKGKGCATCSNKGYKGRLALYQIMPITEDIRLAILRGASTDELRKMTIDQGVKTIRTSGITKVCQGITTLKEVEGVSIAE